MTATRVRVLHIADSSGLYLYLYCGHCCRGPAVCTVSQQVPSHCVHQLRTLCFCSKTLENTVYV